MHKVRYDQSCWFAPLPAPPYGESARFTTFITFRFWRLFRGPNRCFNATERRVFCVNSHRPFDITYILSTSRIAQALRLLCNRRLDHYGLRFLQAAPVGQAPAQIHSYAEL
ncbi:hypothetical protein NDU88_000093 [Pleurodeles waltl]|uniref:Uncharacterized protein n=1 Tax=Pleurodeles waltl TaxID=8319 RepID=A0AAV7KLH4_PLEWA|nr:hypothetical protein NDU88_000093 [Pleurodeles waltl]